jgi:hypothetical protein
LLRKEKAAVLTLKEIDVRVERYNAELEAAGWYAHFRK